MLDDVPFDGITAIHGDPSISDEGGLQIETILEFLANMILISWISMNFNSCL